MNKYGFQIINDLRFL